MGKEFLSLKSRTREAGGRAVVKLSMRLRRKRRRVLVGLEAEVMVSEEEVAKLLEESSRVFEQNNALVATIKNSKAFDAAATDCTVWMLKCSGAFGLTAVAASYIYNHLIRYM